MNATPATSRFDWHATAAEVIDGVDLTTCRALVTGAGSGIGVETARALASAGAETILAARNLTTAAAVADDIRASTGNDNVHIAHLDLLDRASIDSLAAATIDRPLHILVNNAGVMAIPDLRRDPEGHEAQFATNHLGHFRLTVALLPALRAANGARVVSLSSRAHLNSTVDFADIDFRERQYDPALAYAQSKTANVLFAVEAARRWAEDGIEANAVHPGAILDSDLVRHLDRTTVDQLRDSDRYTFKTVAQGAATSVYVATSPELAGTVGRYFENCREADPGNPAAGGIDAAGVAAYALDPDNARRLWDLSEQMNN
ncbi:SDR family NAD(P)-dependent oxidoreductase [Nocardia alba]|uniref:Probable oxidoreductase n=1 Tax=Nocardia alba TaxID=225051 RepID=A0A4R1FQ96_9NOCA|nr:SDR family NAD(P)-dependent oxidoreductase [Nocardia alba]TCJ95649.1 NADP-dependent 3-hydroxy acid dehydrogenase YdfG [Nocardia alba]